MDQAQVVWTPLAAAQFEDAIIWTADNRSPTYAERIRTKVLEATHKLSRFPHIGQVEPLLVGYSGGYRYWIVWGYKLIYRYDEDGKKIYIIRFFHTSQNPDKLIF